MRCVEVLEDGVNMIKNEYKGILIALDGPNGSGKTTLINALKELLEEKEYDVCITREPTETELGEYVRKFAEAHEGIGLACLVVADRYEHIKNEIIPELKRGKIVITDRYILSSLILQEMDGVETEFILKINSNIIKPDLQVAVYADEDVLRDRLGVRKELTRFEKNNQSGDELFYMKKGIETLLSENVSILEICNNGEFEENVKKIISYVEHMWRNH